MISILQGDALERLRELPSDHFHCVVTSPPYWGLRDYGTGSWDGGDPACDHHAPNRFDYPIADKQASHGGSAKIACYRDVCGKCGARRLDQQIGLEASPDEWCARLVEVFREVRRVLRSDGVMFLNIGDSYCSGASTDRKPGNAACGSWSTRNQGPRTPAMDGLKPKDLIGAPWMLAFALRADGWWLRGDYIWSKPNPMPESVTDRCTKSHEYVFHLSKSARYFWDQEAVREPAEGVISRPSFRGGCYVNGEPGESTDIGNTASMSAGRNLRSVWTIATDPLPSIDVDGEKLDHFASYPVELARRCILAGTSAKGCCPACGAPWARVVVREADNSGYPNGPGGKRAKEVESFMRSRGSGGNNEGSLSTVARWRTDTTGWRPTCSCHPWNNREASEFWGEDTPLVPIPCRVLDPFGGSGRTALAAEELGRDCTLIELNPASVKMARAQLERAKARRMIGDAEKSKPVEGQMELEL